MSPFLSASHLPKIIKMEEQTLAFFFLFFKLTFFVAFKCTCGIAFCVSQKLNVEVCNFDLRHEMHLYLLSNRKSQGHSLLLLFFLFFDPNF